MCIGTSATIPLRHRVITVANMTEVKTLETGLLGTDLVERCGVGQQLLQGTVSLETQQRRDKLRSNCRLPENYLGARDRIEMFD